LTITLIKDWILMGQFTGDFKDLLLVASWSSISLVYLWVGEVFSRAVNLMVLGSWLTSSDLS
jgi:hypothetical protein